MRRQTIEELESKIASRTHKALELQTQPGEEGLRAGVRVTRAILVALARGVPFQRIEKIHNTELENQSV